MNEDQAVELYANSPTEPYGDDERAEEVCRMIRFVEVNRYFADCRMSDTRPSVIGFAIDVIYQFGFEAGRAQGIAETTNRYGIKADGSIGEITKAYQAGRRDEKFMQGGPAGYEAGELCERTGEGHENYPHRHYISESGV